MKRAKAKLVKIDWDEAYPVYYVSDDRGVECAVSASTLAKWKRAEEQQEKVQAEMEAAVESAQKQENDEESPK